MIDKICKIFQPTLPVRGATALNLAQSQANQFQPTLPVRGATVQSSIRDVIDSQFQPTLPVRGATVRRARQHRQHREISTHAPRAGSDVPPIAYRQVEPISTHAPRAGSDWRARPR